MAITEIMKTAMNLNWSKTDDFAFTFANNRELNVDSGVSKQGILDVTVKNIDLPQLGSDVESVMQAGEWRIYNAKFQPFTISVTFRDFGSLDLRAYFSAVWMDAQRGYYDDVKSVVNISMNGKVIFYSEDCLITAVSQVQLDNENSQVAEFTVEFSSPYYTNHQIKNFGKDGWDGKLFNPDVTLGGASPLSGVLTQGLNGIRSAISISNTVSSWFSS